MRRPGRGDRLVAALLGCAAVVYAAWVLDLLLEIGDLDPVTSYVSELSVTGRPASRWWRGVDALAGTLVALAAGLALVARRRRPEDPVGPTGTAPGAAGDGVVGVGETRRPARPVGRWWPLLGWSALLVFGVATVLDAANPLSCAATADAACAAREAAGEVPLSHRVHTVTSTLAGAALLAAVVALTRAAMADRLPAAPLLLTAATAYVVGTAWTLAEIAHLTPWSSLLGVAQRCQLLAGSIWLLLWALATARRGRTTGRDDLDDRRSGVDPARPEGLSGGPGGGVAS